MPSKNGSIRLRVSLEAPIVSPNTIGGKEAPPLPSSATPEKDGIVICKYVEFKEGGVGEEIGERGEEATCEASGGDKSYECKEEGTPQRLCLLLDRN